MEDGLSPDELLIVFKTACLARVGLLPSIKIRDQMTDEVKSVRPIKDLEVASLGDTYRIKATFFDGGKLASAIQGRQVESSPTYAAHLLVSKLMQVKNMEFIR